MKSTQIIATLIIGVAIFFLGYYFGRKSIEVEAPIISYEINITESIGELFLEPTKIELKNGSIFTDTLTIFQLEKIPNEKDTTAIYEDYYKKRTYNRTYGTDSTYTLSLESIVQNNRLVSEKFKEVYREKTRVEKHTIVKTPTKIGISVEAPFNLEYFELKYHLLIKQKIDFAIGYNSKFKAIGSIAYYF